MARRTALPSVVAALRETVRSVRGTLVNAPAVADVRVIAGAVALAGILPVAATRLAVNAPVAVPLVTTGAWQDLVRGAGLVGPALAAISLGLVEEDPRARIGLTAIGTFGLLAASFRAAAVPGIGAVVAGAWLIALVRLDDRRRAGTIPWTTAAVAGTLLAGLTLALASAVGVVPGTLRPVGSVLALIGVASTPALVGTTWRRWAVGGVVAALALYAGAAAPFVTGAVVLVVVGAVGAPLLLVALATGGAVSTAVAGLGTDRSVAAAGGVLLAAGVPATLPRALAVAVAVALLLDAVPAREAGGEPT